MVHSMSGHGRPDVCRWFHLSHWWWTVEQYQGGRFFSLPVHLYVMVRWEWPIDVWHHHGSVCLQVVCLPQKRQICDFHTHGRVASWLSNLVACMVEVACRNCPLWWYWAVWAMIDGHERWKGAVRMVETLSHKIKMCQDERWLEKKNSAQPLWCADAASGWKMKGFGAGLGQTRLHTYVIAWTNCDLGLVLSVKETKKRESKVW